jgi:hypothetical protein
MPIHVSDLDLTESVYTFTPDDAPPVHIAASVLGRALKSANWPVTDCHIAPSLVDALKRGLLGVEEAHARRLPDGALNIPGIIGTWGEHHISIDGAHRLWRRWQRGDASFPAYVVPEKLWRRFTIVGFPGDADDWREINKVDWRTPEFMALMRALGGD